LNITHRNAPILFSEAFFPSIEPKQNQLELCHHKVDNENFNTLYIEELLLDRQLMVFIEFVKITNYLLSKRRITSAWRLIGDSIPISRGWSFSSSSDSIIF